VRAHRSTAVEVERDGLTTTGDVQGIVPDPAIVDMNGSTTVIANAVATAASTALPPRSSIRAPTRAPIGAPRPPCRAGRCGPLGDDQRDSITGLSSREARQGRIAYCVMSTTARSFM